MDLIEIQQPVVQVTRNKTYTNSVSSLQLSQEDDDETFGIKDGGQKNTLQIEYQFNFQKIMLENYYQILVKNGNTVTAVCKSCAFILNDSIVTCYSTRIHLKEHHVELYEKYRNEVRQYNPLDGIDVEVEFKTNCQRILFQNYFQILSKNGDKVIASCQTCNSELKSNLSIGTLSSHLKRKHPEVYTKYLEEVGLPCKYEPEDVGDENEIKVEFESKIKRIMFKHYYKIIAKSGDGVTAVCRNCKLIKRCKDSSFSNFRSHLKERHPDMYENYKRDVDPSKYHQLNMDEVKEVKVQFKTYTKQILFEKNYRIFEKNGDKVRAFCNHCKSIFYGSVSQSSSFLSHLKVRHAENHKKYLVDIKCHGNKKMNAANKTGARIGKKTGSIDKRQSQPDENFVKSQSKRRRISGNSNDDGMSTALIKSEHTDHSIGSKHIVQQSNHHQSFRSNNPKTLSIRLQLNTDDGREVKITFKSYAKRILFEKHFKIIEKNEDKLRAICNHCKLVFKCSMYNHNLQNHFKAKHAEIYEKYLADINDHEDKTSNASQEAKVSSGEPTWSQSVDFTYLSTEVGNSSLKEPQTERKRNSETPNDDDETSSAPIESKHSGSADDLLIDMIKREPIVDEVDMSELFGEFEQRQNGKWQQLGVEIVREDPDPDEFVKEEPQFYDEFGNGIYGSHSSTIEINQGANDERAESEQTESEHAESEHADTTADLPIDVIKIEPMVDEIDMNEIFGGYEQGKNYGWQQLEVQAVGQEADPDEIVKEEPQFYDEFGNTISGNDI